MARITEIYCYKFARYFGLQQKPSSEVGSISSRCSGNEPAAEIEPTSEAERKKGEEHKRIVTNKGLNFKTRDWLFTTKLQV